MLLSAGEPGSLDSPDGEVADLGAMRDVPAIDVGSEYQYEIVELWSFHRGDGLSDAKC